jgi:hypothetical protein
VFRPSLPYKERSPQYPLVKKLGSGLQSHFGNACILNWTPWSETASELYRPSDRRLWGKWVPTFADTGCHVVSVTDPSGRILGFLDRSRYFSIKWLLSCTHVCSEQKISIILTGNFIQIVYLGHHYNNFWLKFLLFHWKFSFHIRVIYWSSCEFPCCLICLYLHACLDVILY